MGAAGTGWGGAGGTAEPWASTSVASGRTCWAGEAAVARTLKVTLHPRQRIVLPAKDSFIRNVRPHSGQLRASWPSITQGMARGGSDSSGLETLSCGPRGTFVVSRGT